MIGAAWSWLRSYRTRDRAADADAARETRRWIYAVYAKETLEVIRDRRTLFVMVVLPALFMPLATLGIPYLAERQQHQIQTVIPKVAVVGQAPALIHLAYTSKLVAPVRAKDPTAALRQRQVLAVVEIPKGFETIVARNGQAHVGILYDATDTESAAARAKVVDLLSRYSQGVVAARLAARHLNPRDLLPVVLDQRNVATQRQESGQLLASLLPFLVAMWAVVGGMSVAVDLAAGEKERGTLESLLVAPPSREAIVIGKFLSVLTASMGGVVVVLVTMMVSLRWGYPYLLHTTKKIDVNLPVGTAIVMLGVALLFSALVSAVQLAISIYARSPREAQQYITPLYFVTVLPGLAVQFVSDWARTVWAYLTPVLNAFFAFQELLLGTVNWGHLFLAAISCAFYAALALEIAIGLMSRESVIFRV
ncbi:MAG TPA: ABC transporter permease subunit [bacterium]|nr:ABC transporter permease subunit [bacterium]